MKINYKKLIISILIPLGLGALIGFLTNGSMEQFMTLNKPPLSPPPILFPIAWSILYTLMGVASYLVWNSDCTYKKAALRVYALQLLFNLLWPIIFFTLGMYLFAFIWLIILLLLVLITFVFFYGCNKASGYLLIPYILWLLFAGYLNIGIYLLN